jgi:hypothetical protein
MSQIGVHSFVLTRPLRAKPELPPLVLLRHPDRKAAFTGLSFFGGFPAIGTPNLSCRTSRATGFERAVVYVGQG